MIIEQGIHVIVGSLGDGKTLRSLSIAEWFIQHNFRVATNINIRVERLCSPDQAKSLVTRLPDKPSIEVLKDLGSGAKKKGDYGLLLLDELGIWMNSREYGNKDRLAIVKFIIEARKRRWIPVFIAQKASLIDKQVRDIGATIHQCKCTKNVFLLKWLPSIHYVTMINTMRTKAGSSEFYRGLRLYGAYDTEQRFEDSYDIDFGGRVENGEGWATLNRQERHYKTLNGYYSYLPPKQLKNSYVNRAKKLKRKNDFREILQSAASIFLFAITLMSIASIIPEFSLSSIEALNFDEEASQPVDEIFAPGSTEIEPTIPGMRIIEYIRIGSKSRYTFSVGGTRTSQATLESRGYVVKDRGAREALIIGTDYEFRSVLR